MNTSRRNLHIHAELGKGLGVVIVLFFVLLPIVSVVKCVIVIIHIHIGVITIRLVRFSSPCRIPVQGLSRAGGSRRPALGGFSRLHGLVIVDSQEKWISPCRLLEVLCSSKKHKEAIDLTMAVRSVGFQEAAEQLRALGSALLPSPKPTTPQTSPENDVREATLQKSSSGASPAAGVPSPPGRPSTQPQDPLPGGPPALSSSESARGKSISSNRADSQSADSSPGCSTLGLGNTTTLPSNLSPSRGPVAREPPESSPGTQPPVLTAAPLSPHSRRLTRRPTRERVPRRGPEPPHTL